MIPISPVPPSGKIAPVQPGVAKPHDEKKSSSLFADFLSQTNQDQVQSNQAIEDLVQGKTDSVQQVVLAVAKAEMTFQLFMEIRNKLVEAYNELMRMQF